MPSPLPPPVPFSLCLYRAIGRLQIGNDDGTLVGPVGRRRVAGRRQEGGLGGQQAVLQGRKGAREVEKKGGRWCGVSLVRAKVSGPQKRRGEGGKEGRREEGRMGMCADLLDALDGDDLVLHVRALPRGPLEDGRQLQHVHERHAHQPAGRKGGGGEMG